MSDEATWYAQLSGRFWRHPKALSLSDAAGWLWCRALSYVVDNRTDGVVTSAVLRTLRPKGGAKLAAELVAAGLWDEHPAGHVFHDYADHGMTVAGWEEKKAEARERQAKSRAARAPGHTLVTRDKPVTGPAGHTPVTNDSSREDSGLRTQDSRPDQRSSSSSASLDQVAREPAPRAAAPPTPTVERGAAPLAEAAWTRVVVARGGTFAPHPSTDGPVFRVVAELVGRRGTGDLTADLEGAARAFWAQRRSPKASPSHWLEWLQREASAGATHHGVSPAHEFDPSPIPGRSTAA